MRLPDLSHGSLNARPRLISTLDLLNQGLLSTYHKLDTSQLAGVLEALAVRLRYLTPEVQQALVTQLLQKLNPSHSSSSSGAARQQQAVSTDVLAKCAKVLAAIQSKQQRQHQQGAPLYLGEQRALSGGRMEGSGQGPTAGSIPSADSSSRGRMEGSSQGPTVAGSVLSTHSSSSPSSSRDKITTGSSSGAEEVAATAISPAAVGGGSSELALGSSSELLWRVVYDRSKHQLDQFSVENLMDWTWAFVRSRRWMEEVLKGAIR